jgi:hypothetical protein
MNATHDHLPPLAAPELDEADELAAEFRPCPSAMLSDIARPRFCIMQCIG